MATLADISALRQLERETKVTYSLTEKRRAFEQRKREEWQAIKAGHNEMDALVEVAAIRQRLANVMLDLHQQGYTKKQLGEAYGSKDARTINELLDSGVIEAELSTVDLTQGEGETWILSVVNYRGHSGEIVLYADEDGDATVLEMPASLQGTELHQEIIGGLTGEITTLWENRG